MTVPSGIRAVRDPAVPVPVAARSRPPSFGCGLIPRTRVEGALASRDGARGPMVVTVTAPAGAGKTAALVRWAAGASGRGERMVWLTLAPADNDPHLLAGELCAVLDGTGPGRARAAGAAPDEVFAATTDAVHRGAGRLFIVVDDVQQLHERAALDLLVHMGRFLPEQVTLVLSGRFQPAVGLHRLALDGTLTALDTADLAFTSAEARAVLAQHALELADDDLDRLMTRTAGWAAGVRMAAVMLAGCDDVGTRLAEFSGDTRAVADYLTGEILAALPADVRRVLLSTAHEESISVRCAEALSGERDAGGMLDRLAGRNCLVTRYEGPEPVFCLHPLLRSYLVAEMERQPHAVRAAIHARAVDWFTAEGAPLRVLEHAVAAGFPAVRLSEMLACAGVGAVMDGHASAVRTFLATLPAEMMSLPGSVLAQAAAHLGCGDTAAADVSLDKYVEQDASRAVRGIADSIRLQRALWSGPALSRTEVPPPAPGPGPGRHELLDAHRLLCRGWLLLIRGDPPGATAELERSVALAGSAGVARVALSALSALSMAALASDTVVAMDRRSRAALDYAHGNGLHDDPAAVTAHVVAAWVAYQRCECATAEERIAAAVRACGPGVPPALQGLTRGIRSVIELDGAARPYRAACALHEVVREVDWSRMPLRASGCGLLIHVRTALRVGEVAWAAESAAHAERIVPGTMEAVLARVGMQLQHGRHGAARERLEDALRDGAPGLTRRVPVDALVVAATLAADDGDAARAHGAMTQALAKAMPETLVRPFRDGGPVAARLLAEGIGRYGHRDGFAQLVLDRLGRATVGSAVPLTRRELELLVELPSMRTTEEIAASLYVSVNTVKTHLRSIYRKLDVGSRRDAVDAARSTGLL
ncbi:helix-turn-helix transcriptional regulator [Tomitella gaofuii]|uniref:helix-turn-helix transcriptional regulator n=1 Tax=Tomitella gaofuii TaxID=2760083 RepID=UPI0030B8374F